MSIHSENPDFRLVTFKKEREKILEDLGSKSIVLAGLTDDHHQFLFNVRQVEGEKLVLDFVAPVGRGLKPGESIEIMFGLSDGQYLVRSSVESANQDRQVIPFGQEVYRLQRRSNFRTPVPDKAGVSFKLINHGTKTYARLSLKVIDLSAGGIRLKWEGAGLERPKEGDQIGCLLGLPGGKQLELFGTVKVVYFLDGDKDIQVGLEF